LVQRARAHEHVEKTGEGEKSQAETDGDAPGLGTLVAPQQVGAEHNEAEREAVAGQPKEV
jgi:hypothetical protein